METVVIGIAGMHCQGCVKNVGGVLRALPGVDSVEVSLEAAQARIVYDARLLSVERLRVAIEDAGFDAL